MVVKKNIYYLMENGSFSNHSIIKSDHHNNWYIFRHGQWENYRPDGNTIQYKNLASARKAALNRWVNDFKEFKTESLPEGFNSKNMYYEEGDEKARFWSEGFLYPLLGKEDARTLLAWFRKLEDISKAY